MGQQGTVTRLWALKGTRPRVVRQKQYEYAYVFGAVCPERGASVGLVMPMVNTAAMQLHLRHIAVNVPKGKHAVIVLDRAGWHTTKKLAQFKNITLVPLPAGSPELNPQEQVWQQLRDRYLANRCFKNYDDIVDNCCHAWNDFTSDPTTIARLCTREWAKL